VITGTELMRGTDVAIGGTVIGTCVVSDEMTATTVGDGTTIAEAWDITEGYEGGKKAAAEEAITLTVEDGIEAEGKLTFVERMFDCLVRFGGHDAVSFSKNIFNKFAIFYI